MPEQGFKAFFFDLDGTLIDTETLYIESTQRALADFGCVLSQEESVDIIYGKSWRDIHAHVHQRDQKRNFSLEEMLQGIEQYFLPMLESHDILIRSSIDLLLDLATDAPVAIVSGSRRQDIEQWIARMGISDSLAFYLGAEDYSPGKPHPNAYLTAAKRMKVPPPHCLVFEDSQVGVCAAKSAGMYCIGLQREGAPKQNLRDADWIFPDLSLFDLETILADHPAIR